MAKDATHTLGHYELYGGGTPGNISGTGQLYIVNITQRLGRALPTLVLIRLPDPDTVEQCLESAAAQDLIALNESPPYADTFETDAAAPTVDGVELKAPLSQVARENPLPKGVDVLGGSNLDEGTEFMTECPVIACNATHAEFEAWSIKQFGPLLGPKVPSLYQKVEQPAPLCQEHHHHMEAKQQGNGPPHPPPPPPPTSIFWQAAMRSAGDAAIKCRTRDILARVAQGGAQAWQYFFTLTPKYSVNMPDLKCSSPQPHRTVMHC
jgi:hypothetical protein